MADANLNVTLSDLSLDAVLETGGNVLHVTLDGASLSATASVIASGYSDLTLESATSAGVISVKAQASLSKTLDNTSAMAFGEVYTGINSPYEDVVSWTGHPLSGSRVRVRTGNLRGIFGINSEFGIYAGDGWDAKSGAPPPVNSQYIRLGNYTNEFHNVPVRLYDNGDVTIQLEPSAPSFAMGNPLPSGYGTGIGLWQGKDTDGIYKWRIGNPSGANLSWNGSSLLLQNASLDVSGSNVHIALGNPPPTSKTTGTGIWMDNSGIYGLYNNVKQVYIDTATGIFYSGAGTVRIDEDGANIVIGNHDEYNRLTGIELNSTGLYGKVADDVRFALANTGVPFLKLGAGTKDIDLTGIQIDETEIVGQNNGEDQVVFSADGELSSGGDRDIVINRRGLHVYNEDSDGAALTFTSGGKIHPIPVSRLTGYTAAARNTTLLTCYPAAYYAEGESHIILQSLTEIFGRAAVTLSARGVDIAGGYASIDIICDPREELGSRDIISFSADRIVSERGKIILRSYAPTEPYEATPKVYVDGAYTRANTKTLIINCALEDVGLTADDIIPARIITIPIELNNAVLINADAVVYNPSTSGLPEFRIYNMTNSKNILSTNITIDVGEFNSYTAAAQPVIDDNEKTVLTGDRIAMFVKSAGTGTVGLDIIVTFIVP